MGVTFPNETQEYRGARAALLKCEVALRREMEAVAASLRALPPGGEVHEDYLFDCIGADGSPSTVRLSALFRGGDTLMLYHYMFPRHAEDRRPGPTAGHGPGAAGGGALPFVHRAARHVGGNDAPF